MNPHKLDYFRMALEIVAIPFAFGLAGVFVLRSVLTFSMLFGGVILAIVFSYASYVTFGETFWNVIAALIGVYTGPALILALAGKPAGRAVATALLKRLGAEMPEDDK